MQIAVCDDEKQDQTYIAALVNRYAPACQTVCFDSADELLSAAQATFYPLIILDIEMDDTDGFSAARQLTSGTVKPLIIFVTKSTDYAVRGYDVAFHYLVKPLDEDKFREVLDRALRLLTPQYFSFSAEGELHRIPLQDILYFESQNYTLLVHTKSRIYKTRLSLRSLETQLSSADFLRVHAGFLINLHYVVRITRDDVEMQNGQLIKISRSRKKETVTAFTRFARANI